MTVILEDINDLTKEEALLLMNNMMADFSSVRLQVSDDGAGATDLLMHDTEVIDSVIELLFKKINKNEENLSSEIESLQKRAFNQNIKNYHALSYDDGNTEINLKSSIKDITDINSKFVKFIKTRSLGDNDKYKLAKKQFLDKSLEINSLYDVKNISKDHTIKLRKRFELQGNKLKNLEVIIEGEIDFRKEKKGNMLPQLLTTVAIAAASSKIINFVIKKLKEI